MAVDKVEWAKKNSKIYTIWFIGPALIVNIYERAQFIKSVISPIFFPDLTMAFPIKSRKETLSDFIKF
jgi:hypothetical protein